jgi:hypothetical protein
VFHGCSIAPEWGGSSTGCAKRGGRLLLGSVAFPPKFCGGGDFAVHGGRAAADFSGAWGAAGARVI